MLSQVLSLTNMWERICSQELFNVNAEFESV